VEWQRIQARPAPINARCDSMKGGVTGSRRGNLAGTVNHLLFDRSGSKADGGGLGPTTS
jgi:hypothetical protein